MYGQGFASLRCQYIDYRSIALAHTLNNLHNNHHAAVF